MRTSMVPALLLILATPIQAQTFDVVETTIGQVHQALAKNRLTCHDLVQRYLERIAAYDKTGPALNTIQTLNPRALALADSLDRARLAGAPMGPLHCVPVMLKDQIETSDLPTTYGSALFRDFIPKRDATVVTRLRAAGAIILAKTTMGEFASRYLGSAFGIVRNAYDPTRNPSGSSGGTGSSVAANLGLVGIGEDTGGSVRGPASVNALVGLRPTLQLVSRFGMLPANPTQDTMGPMARTVMDAALLLDIMAGYDAEDPITAYAVSHIPKSYADGLRTDALRGARIGILRQPMDSGTDLKSEDFAKVAAVVNQAVAELRTLGAVVIDSLVVDSISLVHQVDNNYETEQATDRYLAQHPNAPVKTFKDILLSGVVVPSRARALIGLVNLTPNDPGYLTVIARREMLRQAVLTAMANQRLDAIVYPTFWHQPTTIPDSVLARSRPNDGYSKGDNRALSPAIGFPALTVPAGFTVDGLPVGIEFLGRPWSEPSLLGLGYAYEQGTHHRRPPRLPWMARGSTQASTSNAADIMNRLRPPIRLADRPDTAFNILDRMRYYHVPGVSLAVVDNFKIVYASGFGVTEFGGNKLVDTSTLFLAGSISKPVFATGVLQLVEQGKLSLDEDINSKLKSWKLPDSRFTQTEKVTLRRLLTHSAGLTVWGFPGYEMGTPIPTVPQVLDSAGPANTGPVRNDTFPGARWRYSGGGITIAQLMSTDVTGEPFPALMKRLVLDRVGMKHSTYENPLPKSRDPEAASGHETFDTPVPGRYHVYPEMAAAGLWTTAPDLARWAIALTRAYNGDRKSVLSPEMAGQMVSRQVQVAPPSSRDYWGLGVTVAGEGDSISFSHGGRDEGFIASVVMWPKLGRGLFILTNGVSGSLLNEISRAFADMYGLGAEPRTTKKMVAMDAAGLTPFAGRYEVARQRDTLRLEISTGPNQLRMWDPSLLRTRYLLPAGGDEFFDFDTGAAFTFQRENGQVTAITQGQGNNRRVVRRVLP